MRQLKILWLLSVGVSAAISVDVLAPKVAQAQDVRILYPQEGQDVRGEITARFEGIPAGGYAVVKIDGQFRQASAQDFVVLDTLSDRVSFARGDAPYKLEITVLNAGGKRVGTSSVTFNVANSKVETGARPVRLVHWSPSDRLTGGVQRFRVFAEANATTTGGAATATATGGGAAVGGGAPGGGGASAGGSVPAPLDLQVSALMRRVLRDTNMLNGSANIQTIVQEAFERGRKGENAGAAGADGGGALGVTTTPVASRNPAPYRGIGKAPWNEEGGVALWNPAPETGNYFIKMIQQDGTEINPTRKAPSLAIADLLPTFPNVPVRPGSTWGTTMSFVGELSSRTPINVKDAPMTFTAYEDLQTPSGENRRCAKLESRFRLPENLAKRIAASLANKSGGAGGGAAGGAPGGATPGGAMPGGEGGAAAGGLTENDIEVARTDVARVLWFDIERRRILRAEDTIRSSFEKPATAVAATGGDFGGGVPGRGFPGGGFPGGGFPGASGEAGGVPAVPAEPEVVSYNLSVTTWLDDRVPNPTGQYLPGGAGAHTRDSVAEPGLSRILRSNVAAP
jgi:hypothetical protein